MTQDTAGLLYEAAKHADDAYQKALEAQFGKNAGDARYDKRGESTLLLRDLKRAKQAADLAWHNAMRSNAYLAGR